VLRRWFLCYYGGSRVTPPDPASPKPGESRVSAHNLKDCCGYELAAPGRGLLQTAAGVVGQVSGANEAKPTAWKTPEILHAVAKVW
jgi:hypothetical protein